MYCTKCGNEIDTRSNFCPNCSAEIVHKKEGDSSQNFSRPEKADCSDATVYFLGAVSVVLSLSIFFPWLSLGGYVEYSPLGLVSALGEIEDLSYFITGSSNSSGAQGLETFCIAVFAFSIVTLIANAANAYFCFAKKRSAILGYLIVLAFSAISIVATFAINSSISSYASSYFGLIGASYASGVLSVTVWPWLTAALSIASVVLATKNRSSSAEEPDIAQIEDILVCSECHAEILPEHKFCPACSAPVPQDPIRYIDVLPDSQSDVICPACGAEVDINDIFCKECALRLRD